jgi:calcineurin-like phosphoesterase family protein
MKYYISDLHLFHNRILEKFNRPFSSVEEMHEMIINNWKNKVKADDTVYILGDVGMYHPKEIGNILNNLPGHKILITGNHDFKNIHSGSYKKVFDKITSYLEIEDNGRNVILFHYPIEDWNGKYREYYHLHGHIHNNEESLSQKERRFNVSAEVVDYTPVSLDELEQN